MERQGFQCGFCTAGMVMTAATFDDEQKADLPRNLKGNLCRCTGYTRHRGRRLRRGRARRIEPPGSRGAGIRDRGGGPARSASRPAGRRRPGPRQPGNCHRRGALHPGRPGGGAARAPAREAPALAARPRPRAVHRCHGSAARFPAWRRFSPTRTRPRSCFPRPSTSSTPTTRTTPGCWMTWCASSGSGSPPSSPIPWPRRKPASGR